jgi:hypothetical protein
MKAKLQWKLHLLLFILVQFWCNTRGHFSPPVGALSVDLITTWYNATVNTFAALHYADWYILSLSTSYNYFSFTSLGDETLDTRVDATFQYQLKHLRPKSRCFMTLHKLYQKWQTWWIATHFLLHNSSYATLCSEALDLVEQPGNGNNEITWDVPSDTGTANAEPRESFMTLALRLSEGSPLGVSLTLPRAVKAFNAAWSEGCKTKHHLTMRYFRHHVDDA